MKLSPIPDESQRLGEGNCPWGARTRCHPGYFTLLRYYGRKNVSSSSSGFTLIELLVVIIIVGILGAIALPSFLNQTARARHSEAVTYLAATNRAQQAYYQERLQFATSMAALGLGYSEQTEQYTYAFETPTVPTAGIEVVATPVNPAIRGFVGTVFIDHGANDDVAFGAMLCSGDFGTAPELTYTAGADGRINVAGCQAY